MNSKIYKSFGIFVLVVTFILIAGGLFVHIKDIWIHIYLFGGFDHIFEIALKNILFSTTVFVLGFFPGLFYYRFRKEEHTTNKLIKSALILMIIPLIVMIFVGSALFSRVGVCEGDPTCEAVLLMISGIPALVIYCIGILLLIIHKFKTKNFKLKTTEKVTTLIVIILMVVFMAAAKGITLYGESPLSIEKCDSLKNPEYRDTCHYNFSRERPDLSICEKIQDSWPRDMCYKGKAGYYNDSSYCDKITNSFFKNGCLKVVR